MRLQISALRVAALACAVSLLPARLHAWQADNGDGTFTNPILYADYPDPDIIRVAGDFYFATTTFVNSPGLRLLHSRDLVNWEIVANIIDRIDGRPEYDMQGGTAYRHGIFAPSLRYHDGRFHVAVTPVGQPTRIYTASDPHGPWSMHEIDASAFDPSLFFDSDGTACIVTSGGWDGTITMLTLDKELRHVVAKTKIHFNRGAEGSKLIKRGDWYYLFNAIPSRLGMTVSRAHHLEGPWETTNQIDSHTGGHQGAIVDLPDGSWYGFVHRDSGAIGRMTQISPIFWQDDWPVWGTPDAPGRVPASARKPIQGQPLLQPATSDDFSSPKLGLQWAWNHNPDNARWSLTERPGFLRLHPTAASGIWTARNTLTQKGQGPWSRGEVTLDVSHLAQGDICGFGTFGKFSGHIAITRDTKGALQLTMQVVEDTTEGPKTDTRVAARPLDAGVRGVIHLRTEMDFRTERALCSYSVDGNTWTPLGEEFPMAYDWRTGTFQGEQYAIFCYNSKPGDGFVDVDAFDFVDHP